MQNGVSTYDISSKGLVYAYDFESAKHQGIDFALYRSSLLNILQTQKFDSIPLINMNSESIEITGVARRRLHDGDHEDIFILMVEEVTTLPQNSSIIECIFSILSNEHHVVFLVDELNEVRDVVTLSMLTSTVVKNYLILLTHSLCMNGWHWNNEFFKKDEQFRFTQEYPINIYNQLVQIAELIEGEESPTDFQISVLIAKLLDSLQPLKFSYNSSHFNEFFNIDFPLSSKQPIIKTGTAAELATHPFGAIQDGDKDNNEAVFFLFAEANNWDQLLLQNKNGKYIGLLQKNEDGRLVRRGISKIVADTSWEDTLQELGKTNFTAIQISVENSPYPGVITASDFIYSDITKNKILNRIVSIENQLRVLMIAKGIFKLQDNGNEYTWKTSIIKTIRGLEFDSETFSTIDKIFSFRNQLVHHHFAKTTNDEVPHIFRLQFYELETNLADIETRLNSLMTESKLDNRALLALSFLEFYIVEKTSKSEKYGKKDTDEFLNSINKITQNNNDFTLNVDRITKFIGNHIGRCIKTKPFILNITSDSND